MSHSIYTSQVFHQRLEKKKHRFQYSLDYHLYDLEKLEKEKPSSLLFSYNSWGIFSLRDSDHLKKRRGSIKEKLLQILVEKGFKENFSKIELLTCPRFFNYVFNPVSFFFCQREAAPPLVVVEVNNTFSEKHIYVLDKLEQKKNAKTLVGSEAKTFHVSPFFSRDGDYEYSFSPMGKSFEVRMTYVRNEEPVFFSRLWGQRIDFTSLSLIKQSVKAPFGQLLTSFRILWQAAKLYYMKKLEVFKKPAPLNSDTIRSEPDTLKQKLGIRLVTKHLAPSQHSRLKFLMPNGEALEFGDSRSAIYGEILVHSYDMFWKILYEGDIGFARSFIDGDWTTDNLESVLQFFLLNENRAGDKNLLWAALGRGMNRVRHLSKVNSLSGASKNIRNHYDLSNDLFESFLDPHMQYSCAYFESPDQGLDQAQVNKMNRLLAKLKLERGHHVLDIGCGWGGLALHIAKLTSCRVTGITLSKAQLGYAQKRAREQNLDHLVDFVLVDFRNLRGRFDRVVSCEMIEAIGERNLKPYFHKIDQLLRPGGRAVIQAISISNQRYRESRLKADFIQHFVFPGSACPSLEFLVKAISTSSSFDILNLEDIGQHYARTLNLWDKRVLQNKAKISQFGFDERFFRLWHYYMKYCEIGFKLETVHNYQIILGRPHEEI